MPIYMDVHNVPGVKAGDVAGAHAKDLLHQDDYGCKCMTYWVDEWRETIFCLIEAPDKDAVREMHRKAHGLVPNKIIEVSNSVVQSFLGRIYDPEEAEVNEEGLKVFSDPSFRVLLMINTTDPVLLRHQLGAGIANELLNRHHQVTRKDIAAYGGSEVEHGGNGFIISFTSAAKAVACALALQHELNGLESLGIKMSISAGEPIEKSNKLFGDAIQKAQCMCAIGKYLQVALASSVKEMVAKDYSTSGNGFFSLPPQDEQLLETLFAKLEAHWQDPDFDIDNYCHEMAMSKSQLYRKTVALTGMSPNTLLKEYRLERAKQLMNKQHYNVSQITFDSGFSSPSDFTKCFKKKFGLLPMSYMGMLG
jgi:AraC-like DNA-binding protein